MKQFNLTMLLSVLCSISLLAQTVEKWQKHHGLPGKDIVTLDKAYPPNGNPAIYQFMDIPGPEVNGWVTIDDPTIDFGGDNVSKLQHSDCHKKADFTYFQTFINFPADYNLTSLFVKFTEADDGARAYVIHSGNKDNPDQQFIPGTEIKYNGPQQTADLKSLVKLGERNRIVIVQFDDCAVGNHLMGATIELNGEVVVPEVIDPCGTSYGSVEVSSQTWMDQNLKALECTACSLRYAEIKNGNPRASKGFYTEESVYMYYNNKKDDKHGAMYNYEAITKCDVCPEGYRIPTKADWEELINNLGGMRTAGKKLLKGGGSNWEGETIGRMDAYGSVLRGRIGFWWAMDEDENDNRKAYTFELQSSGRIKLIPQDKRVGNYVRCIKAGAEIPDITKKDGVWTFGWGTAGEQFNEFEGEKKEGPNQQITRFYHAIGGDTWWSVAQNTSGETYHDTGHDVKYPAKTQGAMALHPGKGADNCAKARFTAAADGDYTIHLKFQFVDAQFSKNRAEVWTNSSAEFNGQWNKLYSKEHTKEMMKDGPIVKKFDLSLKKGEVVSIEIEGAGGYHNDHTLVTMSAE